RCSAFAQGEDDEALGVAEADVGLIAVSPRTALAIERAAAAVRPRAVELIATGSIALLVAFHAPYRPTVLRHAGKLGARRRPDLRETEQECRASHPSATH